MRRLHVVPFDRTFAESEIDRDLFDRIIENELSGVLNRALGGLEAAEATQTIPRFKPTCSARDRSFWCTPTHSRDSSTNVARPTPSARCSLQKFYDAYRSWATRKRLYPGAGQIDGKEESRAPGLRRYAPRRGSRRHRLEAAVTLTTNLDAASVLGLVSIVLIFSIN